MSTQSDSDSQRPILVQRCFDKILASREFRGTDVPTRILRILFECPDAKALSNGDLAAALKFSMTHRNEEGSKGRARVGIADTRRKLLKYNAENPGEPVQFEIPEGDGYRLVARSHDVVKDAVPLIFKHRENTEEWFRDAVCGPSPDTLWVSSASRHSMDKISPYFKNKAVKVSHFRVLTWRPQSDDIIKSYCGHLDELFERMKENMDSAWRSWKELEAKNDFVEVYGFSSVPTMQAICKADESIKIELLPFNRNDTPHGFHECGSPEHRPALLIDSATNPASFWFFKHSFEDLWVAAMLEADENEVHHRWREKRLEHLAKLGLAI